MSPKSLRPFLKFSFLEINLEEEDKFFLLALGGSVFLHSLSLISLIVTQPPPQTKDFKKIEVVYQASGAPASAPSKLAEVEPLRDNRRMAPSPQILTKKGAGSTSFMTDMVKSPSPLNLHSKQPSKLNLQTKRQVSISVGTDKITNPQYLNYQDRIRERIKNRAHSYVDHPDFEVGTVQVTFVLLADGQLRDVRIIDERTKANDYLRSISLRSIKESSPFPVFPGELKYPELPFSIEISYEER